MIDVENIPPSNEVVPTQPEKITSEDKASRLAALQRFALRAAGCLLAGGAVALPWATTHAITDSVVHDTAGPVPTDIRLARGHSSIDTGLLGTAFMPDLQKDGFGAAIKLTGPPNIISQLASGNTADVERNATQAAHLFGDPKAAAEGYGTVIRDEVVRQFESHELQGGLALAAVFGSIALAGYGKIQRKQARYVLGGAMVLTGALSAGFSATDYLSWETAQQAPDSSQTYDVPGLNDTGLKNTVTSNLLLSKIITNARPIYEKEVARETAANQSFLATAYSSIDRMAETGQIRPPAPGETMFMAFSDMHENQDMILATKYLIDKINEKYGEGTVSFCESGGDNAYGEASAKRAIEGIANMCGGATVFSITGNHGTNVTIEQMKQTHKIHLLAGKTVHGPHGLSLLGDTDPVITDLNTLFGLGQNRLRDSKVTMAQASENLAKTAWTDHPTILQVHEVYELAPFLGIKDASKAAVDKWFATGTDNSGNVSDDVSDQPAAFEAYGHWHRHGTPNHKLYRVVSNSDGTWTLVEELNTAGGANGSQRLSQLSTPWTPPSQVASVVLVTMNNKSGLVVERQQIDTSTAGDVSTYGATQIGSPDGQPYTLTSDTAKAKIDRRNRQNAKQFPDAKTATETRRKY